MLGFLFKSIKPERWDHWLVVTGLATLADKNLLPYQTAPDGREVFYPGVCDVLRSAARLAYAEVN
jgi:hypothetical protein